MERVAANKLEKCSRISQEFPNKKLTKPILF